MFQKALLEVGTDYLHTTLPVQQGKILIINGKLYSCRILWRLVKSMIFNY